ncbi:hypothetical protein CR513_55907, partial [Mucuna pruriens]
MYIRGRNDSLSCKLFLSTLRGVAMHWMTTLLARFIRSFNDLVASFVSQFTTNKVKRVEVADLFNIRQAKDESLKSYLAQGLRVGQFSDALALRRSLSMEEIRAHVEKHIEVEEDQADWLEAEGQPFGQIESRPEVPEGQQKREAKHSAQAQPRDNPQNFTPLKEKRTQILREICHTRLLEFLNEVKGWMLGSNQSD